MSSIQQICQYLRLILKYLNNKQDGHKIKEVIQNVIVLSNNCPKTKVIIQTIESDVNISRELSSDQSKHDSDEDPTDLLKLIDSLIRLFCLLNNFNENELVSSNDCFTIQLSLVKLISLAIIPYISKNFEQIGHLFLSIDSKCLINFDNKLISRQLIVNLCNILIKFLNAKSIISKYVSEHCFASIMASLMTAKHESETIHDNTLINEQLNQLLSQFDQIIVIRNLLLLSRCKANKWCNNQISYSLSQCLSRDFGLINLINAVLDSDQASQMQTTHNQRYQAIGTIVSAMPQLYCSLAQYYESICPQVHQLLMSSNPFYWKVGSMIVNSLENRNRKLTQQFVYDKLLNVFLMPSNSSFSINNAIEMIYHLITCRIDSKTFISIVSHLFYTRVILQESLSHYKSLLDDILVDIFNSINQSVYLLDNILYNYNYQLSLFEVYVVDTVIGVKFKEEVKETKFNSCRSHPSSGEDIDLKQVDLIVQFVTHLVEKLSEAFKLDFFLIILERMTFSSPSLLTCSIVDSLHENVSKIINKYTEKSIKFVVNTFHRLTVQNSSSLPSDNEESELQSDDNFGDMKQNSMTMCLQIVKILLKEKHKLSEKDICQLKQSIPSLEILSRSECFDETSKKIAIDLKNQIEVCDNSMKSSSDFNQMQNEFESAMNELNDHLMPVRAHALIQLKQLIYAKNKHVIQNKVQLINALKMCLNDGESYIYLSAINTLSALAIVCTDDVLPILIEEFNDSQRTIEERVKVGEVLVQLSKYIGDLAHHYSRQYINCFLIGVKSEEPAIRISSLSNLGQFCSVLRFALKPYIVELMSCIESLLKTDDSIEVKRSSVMFLHLMLRGIDISVIEAVDDHLKAIYKLLRHIYSTTIDDILQLHSQIAIEEINRIAKLLLTPNKELIKNIKILSL